MTDLIQAALAVTGTFRRKAPTPTPIIIVSRNCSINEFDDAVLGCITCSQKCATCIGSADHCLQCSQNRTQVGWKCVTN